ncbi:MAG: O-antigen ligase family protein [Coriobacteriia bacterium]
MVTFVVATFSSIPSSWLGLKSGLQTVFDYVVVPLIVYYFARVWLSDKAASRASVTVVAIAGACLGLIIMREQWTGHAMFSPFTYGLIYEYNIRRILSVFGSQVIMSTAVAVMVPWILYGVHSADSLRRKVWLSAALLVTLGGVLFTYVRAGWLGAVLAILVMVALSPATRKVLLPLLPFAIVGGAILAAVAIAPGIIQRRIMSDQPVSYRLQAWTIAWDLFKQSPLRGIGYDNFGHAAAEQFGWNPTYRRHGYLSAFGTQHVSIRVSVKRPLRVSALSRHLRDDHPARALILEARCTLQVVPIAIT